MQKHLKAGRFKHTEYSIELLMCGVHNHVTEGEVDFPGRYVGAAIFFMGAWKDNLSVDRAL